MDSKQEFLDAAFADIDNYPKIAALYRLGDPRVTQQIGAVAAMLALLSGQQEVAALEPFLKEREATILADAAMRGIIPKSKGARIGVLLDNEKGLQPVTLQAQRVVLDSSGNEYRLETPVTIPAGGQASVVARQMSGVTLRHVVQDSRSFYDIEIPPADDGSTLSSIDVSDAEGPFTWADRYTNIRANQRVFHVECDDLKRVFVRFGWRDVVGFQPPSGTTITLNITYSRGDVIPDAGTPFTLDYINSALEAGLQLSMQEVVQRGENPLGIETLREMARYPATYSNNAVFMGNFDYLVRKNFPSLQFSSVWNEAQEELVRGASVQNINALFVAVVGPDGAEESLEEEDPEEGPPALVAPVAIDESEMTELQREIRKLIHRADDSYRIKFYTPIKRKIKMSVTARVASTYRAEDVRAQIAQVLLDEYGPSSDRAKRGYSRPLYQEVYALLRARVPALSGGDSDWQLNIVEPPTSERPELWRFVAPDTLSITVNTVNVVIPSWGG